MQQDGQPEDATGSPASPRLKIPDHELLRCIGAGAFGEIWLAAATSLTGAYRAVKIVYRDSLKGGAFDRELRGIQRFEPISRAHPNLVNILHVGESREAGCFFYVMELADDLNAPATQDSPPTGHAFDPDAYAPRTLEADLHRHGALPFQECLQVAMSLTDALACLHPRGLIHRDVKPANIIFVQGVAKLADIGLVADVQTASTFVGTRGFIPREGPGRPQADIYSLGKVFYEMLTGLDRNFFPQLPEGWAALPDLEGRQKFNNIILRACEEEVAQRYQTAEELRADLLQLQNLGREGSNGNNDGSSRFSRKAIIAVIVMALGAGAFAFYQLAGRRVGRESAPSAAAGLTPDERAGGFKALFNGRDLDGWNAPGSNWVCTDGALTRIRSGGDITCESETMPDDFDLRFEWKIAPGGDSGVLYRPGRVEYQVLDNKGSPLGASSATWAGALFDYSSRPEDRARPAGQWNEGRVLCEGDRIRHYLNGEVILDTRYTQPEWEEARSRLKAKYDTNLDARGGHLVLRDETGQVWYRHIRRKPLE